MKFLLLLLPATLVFADAPEPTPAVVKVPLADVWSRPLAPSETPTDDLRETQLLKGERVLIHESSGPWVRIEAIEQPTHRQHNRWEGYPGWVLNDDGKTLLRMNGLKKFTFKPVKRPVLTDQLPDKILADAETFINDPYLWGGRTARGIDCSGLVYETFRDNGFTLPRDSYEQWMKADHIQRQDLKPGDLIFSSKEEQPKIITHVAIYAGDNKIIEAPQAGTAVRKISFKEKYGKDLSEVESGDHVLNRYVYFGTYLH